MISYEEILKKIKEKKFSFVDSNGDNLLQSFIKLEENGNIPVGPVQTLLKNNPDLANQPDKKGLFPLQLLEQAQLKARIKRQAACHQQEDDENNPPPPSNRRLRQVLAQYTHNEQQKRTLERGSEITFWEQLKSDKETKMRFVSEAEVKEVLQHPCLLFFTGIESFTPLLIDSMTKKIKKALGIYHIALPELKILSARYPGNNQDICNDYRRYHKTLTPEKCPESAQDYIKPFVEKYLRHLYIDPKGKKYSVTQCMKNMRRINIVGYCFGVYLLQEIGNYMAKDMEKQGFTPNQIKQIQSQLLTFNIASDLTPERYQTNLRSYHVVNTHDEVVGKHVQDIFPSLSLDNKESLKLTLPKQPHQPLFFINTLENNTSYTTHEIDTYFNPANATQKEALTWMKAVVFNGINNSFENEKSQTFIPLPTNLETPPDQLSGVGKISPEFHISKRKKKVINPALIKKRRIKFVRS